MLRLSLWLLCITSLVNVVLAADDKNKVVCPPPEESFSNDKTDVVVADMMVICSKGTKLLSNMQVLEVKAVESNTPIELHEDAEITVMFANGDVQEVSGPYKGTLTNSSPNNKVTTQLLTALTDFLENREPSLRGKLPKRDDIWRVDVSADSKRFYCVAPSSNRVILWRPNNQSQSASTLVIKHKPSGQKETIKWPAGQTTLDWPSSLPVYYGDTYTVEVKTRNGLSSFKKLVLYQVPDSLPTDSHKLVWMVGRGCIPQANMLLASLR